MLAPTGSEVTMNIIYRLMHRLSKSSRPILGPDETIYEFRNGEFVEKDYEIDPKLARQEIRQEFVDRYFGWVPRPSVQLPERPRVDPDPWSAGNVYLRRKKIADEDADHSY